MLDIVVFLLQSSVNSNCQGFSSMLGQNNSNFKSMSQFGGKKSISDLHLHYAVDSSVWAERDTVGWTT